MKKTMIIIAGILLAAVFVTSVAEDKPHVYINPGHGGHTGNDRNVVIPPFVQGDTMGFWESNSNMWKGFALMEILKKKGYKTSISRVRNTEDDDLALSTIVALSNASGADAFYSIHSNATGYGEATAINYPMGFYRGYTNQPENPKSMALLRALAPYIIDNKSTVWSQDKYAEYGDWTFQPGWGTQGYGVLRGNRVPAILDEGSFHDYYPEDYRLINHEYCWVEGWAFSLGADAYFDRLDLFDKGIISGAIRDDRLPRTDIRTMIGADKRVPVNEATVRLLDADGNELDSYKTDTVRNGIYLFKYVEPGTYTVEVSHPDYFSKSAQVEVTAQSKTYQNFDLKRQRNTPPEVVNYAPQWQEGDAPVRCNAPIVLEFNWDMDTESVEDAFSIEPPVEGTLQWEDANYRLRFTPTDAYEVSTHYTLTLNRSAKHGGGTPMEEDFVLEFTTQSRNHINELAIYPREGSSPHYKSLNAEFRTDSLIDAYNVMNYMHIFDAEGNEMAWNKRSLKYNDDGDDYGWVRFPLSKELEPGEEYKIVVDTDMSDTLGLKLAQPIEYHFTPTDVSVPLESSQLIEPFEVTTGFNSVDVESDNPATVKLTASSTALFGSKSLQLAYTFENQIEGGEMQIAAPEQEDAFSSSDGMGLYVFGDMSFNHLFAGFTPEGSADVEWVDLGEVDFVGWQFMGVDILSSTLTHTGTYHFAGLKMVKNGSKQGRKGTIRLDNLVKFKPTALEEVTLNSVFVSPNPASDYLVVAADSQVQGVELIDAKGQTVARNATNYVNVSGFAAGVYVLKVYINGIVSTHKVAVAH